MGDKNKKLFRIIKEEQVIAVLLASGEEECNKYLIDNGIIEDVNYVNIVEVAKQQEQENQNVIPLMVAKKFVWYDLRHYKHLYIYEV